VVGAVRPSRGYTNAAVHRRRSLLLAAPIALTLCIAGGAWSTRELQADLGRPLSVAGSHYVRSESCRHCHAEQYESWHRTFHRRMTQVAGEASVLGDFEGARFVYMAIEATMRRDAQGGYRMEFSADGGAERWWAPVDRTVGSRRYQQYLTRVGDTFYRLPLAWNVEEGRWMHMNGAFLTPDPEPGAPGLAIARADYDRHVTRWNDNCIFCHNVAPNPGFDPIAERFESATAELGIACEACHGPASEHVALNHNPLRRFSLHLGHGPDPSIANPARLDKARSAEVCGRCHGQRITADIDRVHREGDLFVPGQQLSRFSRPLARHTTLNGEPGIFEPRFWGDGTARLTAYEYQGLLQSRCHSDGPMQCQSCHAMHDGDPRGQLRPELPDDALCTQCHTELAESAAAVEHGGHAQNSEGNRCLGCHMPKIVYGLVGAHRSHRVDAPNPSDPERPDACTLCHADRSRGWAAAATARMWPRPGIAAAATEADDNTPELTRLLLAGDPIERSIAAAALGGRGADSTGAALAPRLGLLADTIENDDYPAVRTIAWRSLQGLLSRHRPKIAPKLTDLTATDARPQRLRALQAALAPLPPTAIERPDPEQSARLRALRDPTRIHIGE